MAYHLRGKHGQSGPLEGLTISRCTICKGNMDKVDHLRVRQFQGVPFARETWTKWSNPPVVQFVHVSFANGTLLKLSNPQVVHFVHVSLANGTLSNCRTLKWSTLSMFPSQMVRLKIVEPSSGPLCPCFPSQMVRLKIVEPLSGPLCPGFPRKWYTLKFSNPQVVHSFHVSLANGTP